MAKAVKSAKKGGQELLGGMSITIARNGWGSQVSIDTRFWPSEFLTIGVFSGRVVRG